MMMRLFPMKLQALVLILSIASLHLLHIILAQRHHQSISVATASAFAASAKEQVRYQLEHRNLQEDEEKPPEWLDRQYNGCFYHLWRSDVNADQVLSRFEFAAMLLRFTLGQMDLYFAQHTTVSPDIIQTYLNYEKPRLGGIDIRGAQVDEALTGGIEADREPTNEQVREMQTFCDELYTALYDAYGVATQINRPSCRADIIEVNTIADTTLLSRGEFAALVPLLYPEPARDGNFPQLEPPIQDVFLSFTSNEDTYHVMLGEDIADSNGPQASYLHSLCLQAALATAIVHKSQDPEAIPFTEDRDSMSNRANDGGPLLSIIVIEDGACVQAALMTLGEAHTTMSRQDYPAWVSVLSRGAIPEYTPFDSLPVELQDNYEQLLAGESSDGGDTLDLSGIAHVTTDAATGMTDVDSDISFEEAQRINQICRRTRYALSLDEDTRDHQQPVLDKTTASRSKLSSDVPPDNWMNDHCFVALTYGDLNRNNKLSRDEEYVRFLNRLVGDVFDGYSFDQLDPIFRTSFAAVQDDHPDRNSGLYFINVQGSKPGQNTPPHAQLEHLKNVCNVAYQAIWRYEQGPVATSPTLAPAVPGGLAPPTSITNRDASQEKTLVLPPVDDWTDENCFVAMTHGDLNRNNKLSRDEEFVRYLNRLTKDFFDGYAYEELDSLLHAAFESLQDQYPDRNSGLYFINVQGSKPGHSPPHAQMEHLRHVCAVTYSTLSQYSQRLDGGAEPLLIPTGVPTLLQAIPLPIPPPVALPTEPPVTLPPSIFVRDSTSVPTTTVTLPTRKVETPSPTGIIATLAPTPAGTTSLPTFAVNGPQQLQNVRAALIWGDANRDGQLTQNEYVRFLNRLTDDAFAGLTFDQLDPVLIANWDRLKNPIPNEAGEEYIRLDGLMAGQIPTPEQEAHLQLIAQSTLNALVIVLGEGAQTTAPIVTTTAAPSPGAATKAPTSLAPVAVNTLAPSPTATLAPTPADTGAPPTPGGVSPAPTWLTESEFNTCKTDMYGADFDRNGFLNQHEYIVFLEAMSGEVLPQNFTELNPLYQTQYIILTQGLPYGVDIRGSAPDEVPNKLQTNRLIWVCVETERVIQKVHNPLLAPTSSPTTVGGIPTLVPQTTGSPSSTTNAPSPTIAVTLPPTPDSAGSTSAPTLVATDAVTVFSSFVVSNPDGLAASDLGTRLTLLQQSYTILANDVVKLGDRLIPEWGNRTNTTSVPVSTTSPTSTGPGTTPAPVASAPAAAPSTVAPVIATTPSPAATHAPSPPLNCTVQESAAAECILATAECHVCAESVYNVSTEPPVDCTQLQAETCLFVTQQCPVCVACQELVAQNAACAGGLTTCEPFSCDGTTVPGVTIQPSPAPGNSLAPDAGSATAAPTNDCNAEDLAAFDCYAGTSAECQACILDAAPSPPYPTECETMTQALCAMQLACPTCADCFAATTASAMCYAGLQGTCSDIVCQGATSAPTPQGGGGTTLAPTPGGTLLSPTEFTDCLFFLEFADQNVDNILSKSEYPTFLEGMTGTLFPSPEYDQLDERYKENFFIISIDNNVDLGVDIAGSKLGDIQTPEQRLRLEFVCAETYQAIADVTAAGGRRLLLRRAPSRGGRQMETTTVVVPARKLRRRQGRGSSSASILMAANSSAHDARANASSSQQSRSRRRLQEIETGQVFWLQPGSAVIYHAVDSTCPQGVVANSACQTLFGSYRVKINGAITAEEKQKYVDFDQKITQEAIAAGILQDILVDDVFKGQDPRIRIEGPSTPLTPPEDVDPTPQDQQLYAGLPLWALIVLSVGGFLLLLSCVVTCYFYSLAQQAQKKDTRSSSKNTGDGGSNGAAGEDSMSAYPAPSNDDVNVSNDGSSRGTGNDQSTLFNVEDELSQLSSHHSRRSAERRQRTSNALGNIPQDDQEEEDEDEGSQDFFENSAAVGNQQDVFVNRRRTTGSEDDDGPPAELAAIASGGSEEFRGTSRHSAASRHSATSRGSTRSRNSSSGNAAETLGNVGQESTGGFQFDEEPASRTQHTAISSRSRGGTVTDDESSFASGAISTTSSNQGGNMAFSRGSDDESSAAMFENAVKRHSHHSTADEDAELDELASSRHSRRGSAASRASAAGADPFGFGGSEEFQATPSGSNHRDDDNEGLFSSSSGSILSRASQSRATSAQETPLAFDFDEESMLGEMMVGGDRDDYTLSSHVSGTSRQQRETVFDFDEAESFRRADDASAIVSVASASPKTTRSSVSKRSARLENEMEFPDAAVFPGDASTMDDDFTAPTHATPTGGSGSRSSGSTNKNQSSPSQSRTTGGDFGTFGNEAPETPSKYQKMDSVDFDFDEDSVLNGEDKIKSVSDGSGGMPFPAPRGKLDRSSSSGGPGDIIRSPSQYSSAAQSRVSNDGSLPDQNYVPMTNFDSEFEHDISDRSSSASESSEGESEEENSEGASEYSERSDDESVEESVFEAAEDASIFQDEGASDEQTISDETEEGGSGSASVADDEGSMTEESVEEGEDDGSAVQTSSDEVYVNSDDENNDQSVSDDSPSVDDDARSQASGSVASSEEEYSSGEEAYQRSFKTRGNDDDDDDGRTEAHRSESGTEEESVVEEETLSSTEGDASAYEEVTAYEDSTTGFDETNTGYEERSVLYEEQTMLEEASTITGSVATGAFQSTAGSGDGHNGRRADEASTIADSTAFSADAFSGSDFMMTDTGGNNNDGFGGADTGLSDSFMAQFERETSAGSTDFFGSPALDGGAKASSSKDAWGF